MKSFWTHEKLFAYTHSFLWPIWQPEKLGQQAVTILENAGDMQSIDY